MWCDWGPARVVWLVRLFFCQKVRCDQSSDQGPHDIIQGERTTVRLYDWDSGVGKPYRAFAVVALDNAAGQLAAFAPLHEHMDVLLVLENALELGHVEAGSEPAQHLRTQSALTNQCGPCDRLRPAAR